MRRGGTPQDVTRRLLPRGHHGPPAFDNAGALRAWRAQAPLAPEHPGTARPRCRLIGRLPPCDRPARPQRLAPRPEGSACPRSLGHTTPAARFQASFHLPVQRAHRGAHTRPLSGALAPPMPPGAPLGRRPQPGVAERLGAPTTAPHRCTSPQPMCPTPLTPPAGLPVVRALERAGPRRPAHGSPHSARAPGPPRARRPTHHRPPTRHRAPSPGPLAPGAPPRLVEGATAWLGPGGVGGLAWRGDRCRAGRLPRAAWPPTQRHATHLGPPRRRRAVGHAIRPRLQRPRRWPPRPRGPPGPSGGPWRAGPLAACGTPHPWMP